MREYGDNFIPVIPTLDPPSHTPQEPFCKTDPTCICHEDMESISEVDAQVQEGLVISDEATRIVQGKQI